MVRGLYAAASGALVAQSMADNVANNLANVSSNGFKQTLLQIQSAPSFDVYRIQTDPGTAANGTLKGVSVAPLVGPLGTGAQVYDTPEDFTQGPIQTTGNPYDLALAGTNGFFTIATPQGVRYTRDGQFTINANNQLVTMDGNPVLGQNNRPIVLLPNLGPATIGADGTISQAGGVVNQLALTGFANLTALRKQGDNLLLDTGNARPGAATASVQQGALEKSNFNIVRSMVDLITAERWFEANERSIKNEDDATNQIITNIAKPA